MIAVVADTHGRTDHRLEGRTREAVHEADLVIHAGDFITEAVFEAFEAECTNLKAVYGNNDPRALRDRLPATEVIDLSEEGMDAEARVALCHGHEHDETALGLFGRQEGASLVISGHSHRPSVTEAGGLLLLNPGSHADPRWNRPAHAELDVADEGGLDGRLREPKGEVFREFRVPPASE